MVIHPVLPEVYTSVAGLDILIYVVIYLFVYLVDVYALPQFCVHFWGMDVYCLLSNLCTHVELYQLA